MEKTLTKACKEIKRQKQFYQVLSPDGFQIMVQGEVTFTSLKKAKQALSTWIQCFTAQGYYSQVCDNGYIRRISVNELPDYCNIITL